MKHVFLIAISACALALTACGGDSTSSDTTTNNSTSKESNTGTDTGAKLCVGTITLSGISYKAADYDKDSDGCLNTAELNALKEKNKTDVAKAQAAIKARTVMAEKTDIKNTDNDYITINSLKIVGSDTPVEESGSKFAVLDATKNSGKFTMEVGFARDAVAGESIFLGISPEAYTSSAMSSSVAKLNEVTRLNITNNPSSKIAVLNCTYDSNTPKITCSNKDFAIKGFKSMPANANLYLMMCKTANGVTTCLNHANIKLKLK